MLEAQAGPKMVAQALEQEILATLARHMSAILARSVFNRAVSRLGIDLRNLDTDGRSRLRTELDVGVRLFVSDPGKQEDCRHALQVLLGADHTHLLADQPPSPPPQETAIVPIRTESDVVKARSTASSLCATLGFRTAEQVKVATAVSELARNIVQYAGMGEIIIKSIPEPRIGVEVIARDRGPGNPHVDKIMRGEYLSKTGLGLGLLGTKRLMDSFDIQSAPGLGTTVTIRKFRL